jgi:hypothetical protein
VEGERMSAQTIQLSNLKMEISEVPFAIERLAPEEPDAEEKPEMVADEFEIRRKQFFRP